MSEKKEARVWVNRTGAALFFLPKEGQHAKQRKRQTLEEARQQGVRKERHEEMETLDHEIEVEKRRSEKSTWEKRTREASREPLDEATRKREAAWRAHMEEVELSLQELEASAKFGEEKVTRAKAQAIEVYRNLHMTKGEKRTRIEEILNAYDLDTEVLPEEIQKLLDEEEFHDE